MTQFDSKECLYSCADEYKNQLILICALTNKKCKHQHPVEGNSFLFENTEDYKACLSKHLLKSGGGANED